MADPMWSGGPDQFQDRYPSSWALFPDFMRGPFYPADPPLSKLAMTLTCGAFMMVPVIGPVCAADLGAYQVYYADNYDTSPPATHTDTVPDTSAPGSWDPPASTANYNDWQFGQLNDGLLTILGFLGPWYAPDNLHVQIQAIVDALAALTGAGTPTTAKDTARILASIYYLPWLLWNNPIPVDNTEVLAAVADAHEVTDTAISGLTTNVQEGLTAIAGRFDTLDSSLSNLASGQGDILDAIAAIEPGGGTAGAPVWPGLALVTIGEGVALTADLHLVAPMDGVIISITTPPTKTGLLDIAGAMFDYREGQIAFEDDEGHVETWQYLGFRNALFTPKTMKRAEGCRIRVLAGAEGMVYPWTIT